jgi:Flp pilus assembly pilin Flp
MIGGVVRTLRRVLAERDGVTSLEYALLAALTVVSVSIFMPDIGSNLSGRFSAIGSALAPAPTPAPAPVPNPHDD